MNDPDGSATDLGVETNQQIRFKTIHLFFVIAVVASGLVVMGPFSMAITAIVIFYWVIAFLSADNKQITGCFIVMLPIVAGVVFLSNFEIEQNRSSARYTTCKNNIRQIVSAILKYESAHGHLPPACIVDDEGNPMHSWRVLILPYIEERAVYVGYDFDEPWDGPNNSKLAAWMPPVFHCPAAPRTGNKTIYKLVTGPGSVFENQGEKMPSLASIPDEIASAIVLVEDPVTPVNWMQPEDIGIDQAIKVVLGPQSHRWHPRSMFPRFPQAGCNAAALSGEAISIGQNAGPTVVAAAMNVRDGINPDLGLIEDPSSAYFWQRCIALAIYIGLLALPGLFLWRKVN